MLLGVLAFFLVARGSDGVQFGAGPVRLFGGKSQSGDVVFLLDLGDGREGPARVMAFSWRRRAVVTNVELGKTPGLLDPYGLARPNDGTFWILADKGRSLARFDEATGKLVHWEALPEACSGIWNFGGRVIFAPMQFRGEEPLLAVEERGGFRPFTRLKARTGGRGLETIAVNLFECGFTQLSRFPCWWLNGASEVVLIDENEEVRVLPAPSLIHPRLQSVRPKPGRSLESLLTDLPYPIRDILLLQGDAFWLLTNQEGERPVTEADAARSRHVIRVEAGKVTKTVDLPRPARAILGADEGGLLLLYRDGSIDWLNCR
jgi:hypothetical protein